MDLFLKTYVEVCKKEFTKYGFKKMGKNFFRVENDVIQNFNLHRSRYGRSCTVEFGIIPLCYKIEKTVIKNGLGPYNLRMFEDSMEWWDYDRDSSESIVSCVNELVDYIKKYLIPFFERGNDCFDAYREICILEKSVSKPFKNAISMDDYLKYCMTLKIADYNAALAHLKAIEEQWVDAYNSMNEGGYMTKEYAKNTEEQLKKYRKEIEAISNRDMEYISNFIAENEAYSLLQLK